MRGMNGYEAYFLCREARVLESLLAETNNLICAEAVKRIIMGQANNCRLSVEQGYDKEWTNLALQGGNAPLRGFHGDRFLNPSSTRVLVAPIKGGNTRDPSETRPLGRGGGQATWLLLNCENYALGFSEKPPSMMTYTNWLVPKGAFAVGLDINTPSTRNVCGIRMIKQSPPTVTTGFVHKHRYYLHEVSFSLGETLWGERYKGVTFVLSRTMKKSNSPAVVVVTVSLDCEGIDERIFDIRIMTDPDDPQLRRKSEARRLVKAIANRLDYIIKDAIDEFGTKLTGYI